MSRYKEFWFYKDSPLNRGHIKYLIPCDNRILVEILLDERSENGT